MIKDSETRNRMLAHIEEWQATNVTQKVYSTEHNIPYHVFHYWLRVHRKVKIVKRKQKQAPPFIKLKVPITPDNSSYAELLLPDGKRLLFHKPVSGEYLKALIS